MRVGILTPTQASDTPYAQADRYVSKKAVKALLVSVCSRVDGRSDVIRQRSVKSIVHTATVAVAKRVEQLGAVNAVIGTVTERRYRQSPIRSCISSRPIEKEVNGNLDLCYPEIMRTTQEPHPGFEKGCREMRAKRDAVAQKRRERKQLLKEKARKLARAQREMKSRQAEHATA